jgi:hypothetical protein
MSKRSLRNPTRRGGALSGGFALAVAALLLRSAFPAAAQMALPGAVAPTPAGAVAAPNGDKPARKRPRADGEDANARGPAIAPKPPSEDSIAGKTLHLDGMRSTIEFQRVNGQTQVSKLTLAGDRMTRSGESCRIDVSGTPLRLTPRDSDAGLARYQVDFPACPFTLDVLDGAVLITNEGKACELKQADCRTDPAGLWGMGETEFDPKKSKEMLGMRARVEKTMRADFRRLYDRNKADRPLRNLVVREQAGFSSRREEICRGYAQEAEFGYCALRVTEARAITLGTQIAKGVKRPPDLDAQDAEAAAHARKKRK